MKLNPPKKITFWAAVVVAVASLLAYIIHIFVTSIPYLGAVGYVLMAAAFALLVAGLILKGF